MRPLHVRSVGLFAPGFADVDAFLADARDGSVIAPRDALPPRARRGTTLATRMMADVVAQATERAGFDPKTVRTIYSSAFGETATSVALLVSLHEGDGALSPARFAMSVHNAASGLVSIAEGNRAFSTALAAGDHAVAMGLLEAAACLHEDPSPLVVVFADEPVPSVLGADLDFPPLAVALGLSGEPGDAIATIVDVRRSVSPDHLGGEPPRASGLATPVHGGGDVATFGRNPCAAALPLVRALFARASAVVPLRTADALREPAWAAVVAPAFPRRPALPKVADLVPHRPPMLLLDDVIGWDGREIECQVVLRDDSPFVEAGHVPPMIAVEYMAQCVAACAGLRDRAKGQPVRIGYLVGAREIALPAGPLRVGDVLRVRASHAWGDDALGNFICSIDRGGETIARATLNVYRGDLQVGSEP